MILQADKAIAELRSIVSNSKQLRPFGLYSRDFTVPDNFDEPARRDFGCVRGHTEIGMQIPSRLWHEGGIDLCKLMY
jgi:hypothetical protein